jgi:hypothetical protein
MMGWDDAGIPWSETLIEHHLGWTVPILKEVRDEQ